MNIETKFNHGDLVYPISTKVEKIKVPTNCSICNDEGSVEINGQYFTCPNCKGDTYHIEYGEDKWFVDDAFAGNIGKIDVELYSSKYKQKRYYNEDKIQYMLTSTGVGSGTLWKEENLFLSLEEAQAECDKRNGVIKEPVNMENKQCNHKDKNDRLTIEYDSTYEMRSDEMHCTQCGKSGSRKEFEKKTI